MQKCKIKRGINKVVDCVAKTAGKYGKNIIFTNSADSIATKDGVSVVRMFNLTDSAEMTGVNLVRQACEQQLREHGDGTTATAVIMREFCKHKYTRQDIDFIDVQLENLELNKLQNWDLMDIATVSSNGNMPISAAVVEAVKKIGINGKFTGEQWFEKGIKVKYAHGFEFGNGFISEQFADSGQWHAINPKVLIFDNYSASDKTLLDVISASFQAGQPVLIIGNPDELFLRNAINWKGAGKGDICLVQPYGMGHIRRDFMKDILEIAAVGVEEVYVKNHSTVIRYSGDLSDYIAKIESLEFESELERTENNERIARLKGNVARFLVGEDTIAGLRAATDCLDDTIKSCLSAEKHGAVKGGGLALFEASKSAHLHPALRAAMRAPYKSLRRLGKVVISGDIIDSAGVVKASLKNGWEAAKQFIKSADLIIAKEPAR
ncbi:MAG: hypothetical protein LBJ18_03635 [Rickettsiales bacterium]|jgi:chaperonin GroEL|nr:hypothetical protein [Rickettsiales bacterium]